MAKILFLVVLLAVGMLVWRLLSRGATRREEAPPRSLPAQKFVRCVVCDVHIPEHDAVAHQNRYFCGAAHLQEFSRRNAG